ncbi:hypothetical protein HAX54_033694 [Datura stramonium]|uniref:Uncharacterized protein n=1 Tax=Datura stramonium TaxID=4076 RepID=A0ABS8VCW4_DATST|nr:hypothetical protein [Datura stramonium]
MGKGAKLHVKSTISKAQSDSQQFSDDGNDGYANYVSLKEIVRILTVGRDYEAPLMGILFVAQNASGAENRLKDDRTDSPESGFKNGNVPVDPFSAEYMKYVKGIHSGMDQISEAPSIFKKLDSKKYVQLSYKSSATLMLIPKRLKI